MNDTYKMTIKKKMDKLDRMMKKDDYINIYRKDKRIKNFTEFYDYVKNKNYDEFMFGKRNQNLTDKELEEKRKKQRAEHILKEEIIDREDFRFYVWIYKGIDSHLEFDDDYNCRHIQKRMYETSIILEFDEKLEKGYLNCTFDGLLATRSFREDKALRDTYFICSAGLFVGSILSNGDITVCPNVERRPEFVQGNIKNDNFVEVWENRFKLFRNDDRLKCEKCKNYSKWKYCLGDSFHTFNFDDKKPNFCIKDIIKERN